MGRDTEWEKVKEIYRLGLRHGMKLSAISGVKGVYSDDDIAKVVALAKEARKTWTGSAAQADAPPAAARRKPAARKAVAKAAPEAPAKPAARKAVKTVKAPAAKKPPAKPAAAAKTAARKPRAARAATA